MLLGVGLVVAERKSDVGRAEYNCAAGVCDEVCGGVWGWGPVGPPWFPCIGKFEVDGGTTLTIEFAGPVAYNGVKNCERRVGAANTRIEKTIR